MSRSDQLLERLRKHVREVARLPDTAAGRAALEERQSEVERLKEQLASEIKQNPTGGREAWGRSREVAPG